ncbi:YggS family pyridoxal phosphate enzyme [Formosimonas limnophila]|uniref:Pyridoxal phosphate homeostasis protein n=2 Tax=Formosimonas limnophila TaxID=1384487 RepID=A0A8J3CFL6_9BURK|nr:YggS family pyridoxal phosphate enzyme [Formosimonas limnophila]
MAATKTHAVPVIQAAFEAGMRDFGENYVQEGVDKIVALQQLLPNHSAHWHFIGPIQSNKTRLIAEHFDWVHSVDRLKIAQRLSEQRPENQPALNICLQVNISHEPSKRGCTPSEALMLALAVSQMPHLRLRGLMAIPAPLAESASEQEQQAPFLAMHTLFNQIKSTLPNNTQAHFDTLSMGMSADYQHAIAAGSTMVRIGSALFGERT